MLFCFPSNDFQCVQGLFSPYLILLCAETAKTTSSLMRQQSRGGSNTMRGSVLLCTSNDKVDKRTQGRSVLCAPPLSTPPLTSNGNSINAKVEIVIKEFNVGISVDLRPLILIYLSQCRSMISSFFIGLNGRHKREMAKLNFLTIYCHFYCVCLLLRTGNLRCFNGSCVTF